LSSDHQDTPEVELNPRCDINDVYAFPGAPGNIVLVMTTASPIAAGTNPSFDSDKLYQIKIDNDSPRDGIEDLVLQFTFSGTGSGQTVTMRGPTAPVQTGTVNKLKNIDATVSGAVNTTLANGSVRLFAGLRDDPFFLDLERFFRIVPDRRPVTGELSMLPSTPSATCFRDAGSAVDYLAGFNCLAIVVELPVAQLTAGGTPVLGLWGTLSR
jgi:hypothetical protein